MFSIYCDCPIFSKSGDLQNLKTFKDFGDTSYSLK